MNRNKTLFYNNIAQTTDSPLGIEVVGADGIYLHGIDGKKYIDLMSGVNVCNIGHNNTAVKEAINRQVNSYTHLMVYGEYIQSPQVQYAHKLAELLPDTLNNIYFVNSGSEANEGALKLAKRYTGRSEIVSFRNCYHGSTHGAMSVMGGEYFKNSFRPLLPNVRMLDAEDVEQLNHITTKTACVIIDPIMSEYGLGLPSIAFLKQLRQRCTDVGALLIFDEVQSAFGRCGTMFYLSQTVTPDILTLAKALGGGMPLGAFISSKEIMQTLTFNPVLGHITTTGGHPVSCAAGMAAINYIIDNNLHTEADRKGKLFFNALSNAKGIKSIRQKGLFLACDLESEEHYFTFVKKLIANGAITDSFLFRLNAFRITPPLTISDKEIEEAISIITSSL